MENVRKISKKYYLREIVACFLVTCLFFNAPVALAEVVITSNPVGTITVDPVVPAVGDYDFTQAMSASDGAIGNFSNFDIESDLFVTCTQPGANANALFKVFSGDGTQILGRFDATGNVYLYDGAGIFVGASGIVNANSFIASSLDIDNTDWQDFVGGAIDKLKFQLGGASAVRNEGTITAPAGVYLVGAQVLNSGTIDSDLVVMAAGEKVYLKHGADSKVYIETPSDLLTPDPSFHTVDNSDGEVTADQVLLAAGDIFSGAMDVRSLAATANGDVVINGTINATAGPGSDAVATVDIDAVGDVDVEDDIKATATGDSPGGFDAYATITIDAGGDVEVSSDGYHSTTIKAVAKDGANNYADVKINAGGDVSILAQESDVTVKAEAYADEYDAALNQANIELTGENVNIKSENYGWFIDLPDDALVEAYAHDGSQNVANITIAATDAEGEADDGHVMILSEGEKGDDVLVKAEAKNGEDNTASIDIEATGNVYVKAYGLSDEVLVQAEAWNDIELEPEIPEPEVVIEIIDDEEVEVEQEVVVDLAVEGLTNTATIDITAGEDVEIKGQGSGDAGVEALAHNDIEVDIDNYYNEVTVNLTVSDLENNASVTATAIGKEVVEDGVVVETYGGNVELEALGASSIVGMSAQAYNKLEFDQHTGGKYWVQDGYWWWDGHWEYYDSYAATLNLDVSGLLNDADIGITTMDGMLEVLSDECWLDSEAIIYADAWNDIDVDLYCGSTGNLTLDGLTNYANIDVIAGYDVRVAAEDGGESGIVATALNRLIPAEASGDIIADNLVNNAGVTVDAGGSVVVKAECEEEYSAAYIITDAFNDGGGLTGEPDPEGFIPVNQENTATVDIVAGEDVKVMAFDGGDAEIGPEARSGTDDTAILTVNAGGDVLVLGVNGEASMEAAAMYSFNNNTATIQINATGGDVKVIDIGENDDTAKITATAKDAMGSNNADITINATAAVVEEGEEACVEGGDVKVIAKDGGEATIAAFAENAGDLEGFDAGDASNTANITITATAATSERVEVLEEEGVTLTYVDVEGGDVKVIAEDDSRATITAFAATSGQEGDEGTSNTANVTIRANSAEGTTFELVTKAVYEEVPDVGYVLVEPAVYEAVAYTEGGDVKVIGKEGSKAEIEAIAMEGATNTADVLICIDGGLKVEGDCGGEAEIEALTKYGLSNTATVGIGAKGDDGVEVLADRGGEAGISSKAKDGENNTASTIVCTQGGVDVIAKRGGDAEILAQAKYGLYNDAYVGIGAWGDVVVQTGDLYVVGCDALIRAEADMGDICIQQLPDEEPVITTADAEVVVFSHEGSVEVLAYNRGHSGIEAEAQGAHLNTAKVGVAAAADLSPADVIVVPEIPDSVEVLAARFDGPYYSTGNVIVEAFGDGEAQILAWAHDATSIYEYPDSPGDSIVTFDVIEPTIIPGENTAKTVICAPGEVLVSTYEGGEARIKSRAGWYGEQEAINKATTKVYASDVTVNTRASRGQGIWAWAYSDNSDNPHVPGEMMIDYLGEPYDGSYYCMDEHGEVAWTDGDAVLYIQDYSKRTDCPDCPPCPCEEEEGPQPVPPAPLYREAGQPLEEQEFGEGGCPALMNWLAGELGIEEDEIEVAVANSFASSTDIQPCEMCARLRDASTILEDAEGTGVAGLVQVVNEFVATPAPPSEEQMASIATAFADHTDDGTYYAAAGEWIDALVEYVGILTFEMGYTAEESTGYANKYMEPVTDTGNAGLLAYVQARLAALGG